MQWAAFNSISPIGDERCHDLGPALSRQMTAQMHGQKGSRYPLEDFLPFAHRPKIANEAEAKILAWAKSQGTRSK